MSWRPLWEVLRRRFALPEPPDFSDLPIPSNRDALLALLRIMERIYDDEETRHRAAEVKLATVSAVAGAVIAAVVFFGGTEGMAEASLQGSVLAIVLLAVTSVYAAVGGFVGRPFRRVEWQSLLDPAVLRSSEMQIMGDALKAYAQSLWQNEQMTNAKMRWFHIAVLLLLAASVVFAIMLVLGSVP